VLEVVNFGDVNGQKVILWSGCEEPVGMNLKKGPVTVADDTRISTEGFKVPSSKLVNFNVPHSVMSAEGTSNIAAANC